MFSSSSSSPAKSTKQLSEADLIFEKVNAVREQMLLSHLHRKPELTQLLNVPKEEFNAYESNFVLISYMTLQDSFNPAESPDTIVKKWLLDNSKRSTLFAPGNYGTIQLTKSRKNMTVDFIVASVYKTRVRRPVQSE